MSNVTTGQCETHRDALYGTIDKKAGSSTLRWFGGILATILIGLAGAVLAISVAQGKVITRQDEQDKQDAIGRSHREAWQSRMEDKIDKLLQP